MLVTWVTITTKPTNYFSMLSEFEVSTRIRFWGDALKTEDLIQLLCLDPKFCRVKKCGEAIVRGDGTKTGSIAKTSFVSYSYDYQFKENSRHPEKQFSYVLEKLKNVSGEIPSELGVEAAELQLSIYYGNSSDGEPDFLIPLALQKELVVKHIELRITALP